MENGLEKYITNVFLCCTCVVVSTQNRIVRYLLDIDVMDIGLMVMQLVNSTEHCRHNFMVKIVTSSLIQLFYATDGKKQLSL